MNKCGSEISKAKIIECMDSAELIFETIKTINDKKIAGECLTHCQQNNKFMQEFILKNIDEFIQIINPSSDIKNIKEIFSRMYKKCIQYY